MTEPGSNPPGAPAAGGLADFLTDYPATPDTPVLHWRDGCLTLGELTAAARTLAGRLGPEVVNAPVVCLVGRGRLAVTAMFAAWFAGAVYVPVNARLADAELHAQLAEIRPAAVVATADQAARVPVRFRLVAETAPGSWETGRVGRDTPDRRYADGDALVLRTSGTTGASKAVVLRHEGVRDGIDTVLAKLRGGSGRDGPGGRAARDRDGRRRDRPMPNLIPTSLALWAGSWNLLFAFRAGAAAVLLESFDTLECAELIRRFEIRSTILAPAMMAMLAEDPRVTDLEPLRLVRSVTAPLPPDQARRFRDRFGVEVLNSYGQTELGSEVVGWTAADAREYGEAKLGAVGRAHPGVDIRILDEHGRELPRGEPGEIWINSPFANRDGIPAVRDRNGYLRTGDLGRLDADGFLWIEGRVSDMINRGGLKVVPQEVEEVLRRHPRVADACVAGVPDPRLGEVPVAWVRPADGAAPTEAELRSFVRDRLAPYKVPAAVRLLDDFPRTEIGKVLRRELVARYTADAAAPAPRASAVGGGPAGDTDNELAPERGGS